VAGRLALGSWLVTFVLIGVATVFGLMNGSFGVGEFAVVSLVYMSFATVGALVASHHPGNAIGWLFCCAALLMMGSNASGEYATYAHAHAWRGVGATGWLAQWTWSAGMLLVASFLLLLFPDGGLPSRRWRPVAWLAGVSLTLFLIGTAFAVGPLDSPHGIAQNPLGVPGAKVLAGPGQLGLAIAILAAVGSLVQRFRHAGTRQRQQLKGFVTAASASVAFVLITAVTQAVSSDWAPPAAVFLLVIATIPISVGVAILQHRLYDVDVIINRTLVYGVLTATLAGVYLGSVLLLQLALGPVTSGSNLAVAVSTLAVAALFRPARARIQAVVDRRFYRRKYDAARTLEGFSARLREEVDLDALGGELRAVVSETMQPAHVSLWLRAP